MRFGRPTHRFLDRCVLPGAKRREHELEGSARKARCPVFHARSMAIARGVMAIASPIVRQRSGTGLCRTSRRANWQRGHAKGQTCDAKPHCDDKFAARHGCFTQTSYATRFLERRQRALRQDMHKKMGLSLNEVLSRRINRRCEEESRWRDRERGQYLLWKIARLISGQNSFRTSPAPSRASCVPQR